MTGEVSGEEVKRGLWPHQERPLMDLGHDPQVKMKVHGRILEEEQAQQIYIRDTQEKRVWEKVGEWGARAGGWSRLSKQ